MLIAAELVFGVSSGQGGLGWFIYENKNLLEVPSVFAGLFSVILIGLVVENLGFRNIEVRTVRRWGMQVSAPRTASRVRRDARVVGCARHRCPGARPRIEFFRLSHLSLCPLQSPNPFSPVSKWSRRFFKELPLRAGGFSHYNC